MDRNINISISAGTILKAFVLFALFYFLYQIRDIVLVVLTSIVIASSIEPVTLWFKKFGVARIFSVILTYLVLGVICVGILYFFIPSLLSDTINFLSSLPSYLNTVVAHKSGLVSNAGLDNGLVSNLSLASDTSLSSSQNIYLGQVISQLSQFFSSISQNVTQTASFIFGGALSLILIIVLSFYLAVQEDGIAAFLRVVTPLKHERYVIDLWKRSQSKIGKWMQGQILLAVLVGILVYLGLTVFGIKNALFFAVLAAVFETIPLFGPILAAIPPVVSVYADLGFNWALIIAGLFLVIQQFENHLIYPLVVKKIVGVSPILVIIALIVGAQLGGFLGIVLSVPVAATLVEYFDDLQRDKIAAHSKERA